MFLAQVLKYRKWLFAVMIIFIIGQLWVNFKQGVVFSPFYHYGMYSHKIPIEKNYLVWEIKVNEQLLKATDYSPQKWDKIILPLEYYASINTKSNTLYYNDIQRILSKTGLTTTEKKFIQDCNPEKFINWYKHAVERITGHVIKDLKVQQKMYRFEANRLIPSDSIISFEHLCL